MPVRNRTEGALIGLHPDQIPIRSRSAQLRISKEGAGEFHLFNFALGFQQQAFSL
jgi:hypothetical protein